MVGSHAGLIMKCLSVGVSFCSSFLCLLSRARYVAIKWVGSSLPCTHSEPVSKPSHETTWAASVHSITAQEKMNIEGYYGEPDLV